MIDFVIYFLVAALAILFPAGYFIRYRRQQSAARGKREASRRSGLVEPASLHPVIDPNRCICSGGCIAACPEGGIIGILDGKAELVSPTKCIGHGACRDACPVEAITLVFGTETRGVDIPYVSETFETNVPGIYIAGELGGMGLIRNAVTQGREAVEYIARGLESRKGKGLDLVVVGAGPAGLAAALEARNHGLNAAILEQGDGVGGTMLSYPRQKVVMTQPMEIPLYGTFSKREVQKEELVDLWESVVQKTGLEIRSGERVEGVDRTNGHFRVRTGSGSYETRRVLLAIGRRGTPRRLGVPGEESSKVAYQLKEPEQYRGKAVLVVGGGDSAVEAALALSREAGTRVTLSYRKAVFSRLKDGNRSALDQAAASGRIALSLESEVERIEPRSVALRESTGTRELENDFVFVSIGGELPTALLTGMGIRMERKFGTR
jgi:putative YpdA family bacillithiol system oxidoreductase